MREFVFDYMKKKYGVSPEYPWRKYDTNAVFRHSDNHKWFALVMEVGRDKLGLSAGGDVDVINLKIDDPFFKDVLLKEDGILPAYHMNKFHWISVLLDGTVAWEKVYELIDMSFAATASAKKKEKIRPPKEWLIPANPKFFDIIHAFDEADEIEWKQGRGIKAGDTVFIYAAAPVSAILYRCRVTKTGIPYQYTNKNLTIREVMMIKLQKRYQPECFTFGVLKEEYGIYAVRGPRGIPNSLNAALRK